MESANAAIKGAFVDLNRGFLRVMGRTEATVLLAFTIAGYNIDRVRAFRAKHRRQATGPHDHVELDPARPVRRSKRGQGTWAEILGNRGLPPPE